MHKKTAIVVGVLVVFAVALSLALFVIQKAQQTTQEEKVSSSDSVINSLVPQEEIVQQKKYKKVDVNTGAVKFSFEVPESWLTETRHAGGK